MTQLPEPNAAGVQAAQSAQHAVVTASRRSSSARPFTDKFKYYFDWLLFSEDSLTDYLFLTLLQKGGAS